MKVILLIIFICMSLDLKAKSPECFEFKDFQYKSYDQDFFLVYEEKDRRISMQLFPKEQRKAWINVSCKILPDKKMKAKVDHLANSCVYDKALNKIVGKVLFKVINYSNENQITFKLDGSGIKVLGEGSFLSGFSERDCP